MTIYRRWPTKAELFRASVQREFTRVFDEAFDAASSQAGFDDMVVASFSGIVWAVHSHPLMVRELSTEPEIVLPFLTTESGAVMDAVMALVAQRLDRLAVAGDRALADPVALADIFVRLALSLPMVPDLARPITSRADIENYARRYLVPLAQSATTPASVRWSRAATASAQSASVSSNAVSARPSSLRRVPLQLLPPIILAFLLGSGALAHALMEPWSAPVAPIVTTDSGLTPASSFVETTIQPTSVAPTADLQISPAVLQPPPPPPVDTQTAPARPSLSVVDSPQPTSTRAPGRNVLTPALQPAPLRPGPAAAPASPPVRGTAPHPGRPAPGAPAGSAPRPANRPGGAP